MEEIQRDAIGNWIPLMDYATKNGVSLSTLRRHIKSHKIDFKVENGRYLIWDEKIEDAFTQRTHLPNDSQKVNQNQELIQQLGLELQKAREEIAELKMLVALYEEKLPDQKFDC